MVDINLIPPGLRKDGQQGGALKIDLPPKLTLGVVSSVVLILVVVHLILTLIWAVGFVQLSAHRAQWKTLAADRQAVDAVTSESKDIKKQMGIISDMITKRSFWWAPKFNIISDSIPRGLWLRKMTLDKFGLMLEGSVVSKTQNEINNIGLFISALKQDNDFIKDFSSLEVNSIQRSKTNAIEVTDFTVVAKLKGT